MKSGDGAGSGSTVPLAMGVSASVVAVGSTAEKRVNIDEGWSLRKCSRRGAFEQLMDASRSTTRVPIEKGKESVETEEAPERRNVNKLRAELESLKNRWRELDQEVRVLHSNLDGARNDWVRLEGDVLSLTEATILLEAEGLRAVAAYKMSRGFKSGFERLGGSAKSSGTK
ncbi:hypothetical protein B296_00012879 [Ensete ventricosum]|uniref:Uncharacterized protein n=1 Tax=Ensete ventricosum TaxID=4639 RepID=A0A426Z8J7_ENSVE|nr:hypothetical protein B296_00012879 [Ensete ventricosum]